jgi:uncharacterized protein YdhG (YjbR/CyaY superfamily)
MSARDVDLYLSQFSAEQRAGLDDLRSKLLQLVPAAEEGISYGMPAVIEGGKVLAGYACFKNHVSYFPHSSILITNTLSELGQYKCSKGGLQFGVDQRIPVQLIEKLVAEKRKLIAEKASKG